MLNKTHTIESTRCRKRGFTLLEVLIYSSVLVVSAGLITGIFYVVSKANLRNQAENEITNQLTLLEEIFSQKIEVAKGINNFGIGGSSLELNMGNSTTTFSLSNNTIYLQEGSDPALPLNDANKVKITSLTFSPTNIGGTLVSATDHYAWNDNVGWIDFAYPGGNIYIPAGEGELSGAAYILSDRSWISLNCLTTNSCSSFSYKVSSDADGNLSGWAWSENYGWISLSCTTGGSNGENICFSSQYGVKVATTTTSNMFGGEFNNYAWSGNIGWISFNCKSGGNNQTNICCSQASPPSPCSDYKVRDLRLNTSSVKIDLTAEYNTTNPNLMLSRSVSFTFNIITPSK